MATFTDSSSDTTISALRHATETFITDYANGECTCLDNMPNSVILPGETFFLSSNDEVSVEQTTAQSILDLIDELVTTDMFLKDDAMQVDDRHKRTTMAGLEYLDEASNITAIDPTVYSNIDTPQVFDAGKGEFVGYITFEELLSGTGCAVSDDVDDADSSTPRLDELAYFDADTQRMVAYTAFNQLLTVDEDEDEQLPRIHRACDDFEDGDEDVVVREITSSSPDEEAVLAELPASDDSTLFELDDYSVPLTASNLRQLPPLHSRYLRQCPLSMSAPPLSPIVEKSEPSSPGSSVAFAHRRSYVKPLSARRESFLSVSTSPSTSLLPSPISSRASTPSPSWLDTFQTSPSLILSKIIDTVFASDVWHVTPSFTITPRTSSESEVRSPDRVRVRISWVS